MDVQNLADERKNRIILATRQCISTHGYFNFSMQDVAKSASVSKGIIHYYFLNKDDLLVSVLENITYEIEKNFTLHLDSLYEASEKMRLFISLCLEIVRTNKEFYQIYIDLWRQFEQKEDVKRVIQNHYKALRNICGQILNEGISSHIFKELHVDDYSCYILGAIDGISMQWLLDPTNIDYDRITKQINNTIMQNLLNPS